MTVLKEKSVSNEKHTNQQNALWSTFLLFELNLGWKHKRCYACNFIIFSWMQNYYPIKEWVEFVSLFFGNVVHRKHKLKTAERNSEKLETAIDQETLDLRLQCAWSSLQGLERNNLSEGHMLRFFTALCHNSYHYSQRILMDINMHFWKETHSYKVWHGQERRTNKHKRQLFLKVHFHK